MKAITGAIVVLAGAIMITGAMLSKENTLLGLGGIFYTLNGWYLVVSDLVRRPNAP